VTLALAGRELPGPLSNTARSRRHVNANGPLAATLFAAGALSAAAGGHHSLLFAGQPLKEMFKLAPFVWRTGARNHFSRVHR
jgi:hypothetical protein